MSSVINAEVKSTHDHDSKHHFHKRTGNEHEHAVGDHRDLHKRTIKLKSNISTAIHLENEEDKKDVFRTVEELTRICDTYRNELQRQGDRNAKEVIALNNENETLQLEMCRLQQKMEYWKSKCLRQENHNTVIVKNKMLNREIHTLKQDIDVFKSVIKRLSKELDFTQEKLRSKYQNTPNKIPIYSSDSVSNDENSSKSAEQDYDLRQPQKTLLPLLTAYDEVIAEKNEIIKSHEFTLEKFKLECQEIIHENTQLHRIVGETKGMESISSKDWKILQENAALVLEENDLLHEKIEILERKATLLQTANQEKADKMKRKISNLEGEVSRFKSVASEFDKKVTSMNEQWNKMSIDIQHRIPEEEHKASVKKCEELFETMKQKYSEERTVLLGRIDAMESEKQRLIVEVTELGAENEKFQSRIKTLKDELAVSSGTVDKLNYDILMLAKTRHEMESTINEMMRLTESMVAEKEGLEVAFNSQRQAMAQIMLVRSQEVKLIHECQDKIKAMKDSYEAKLEEHNDRVKELESLLDTVGGRHQGDISQFKDLVREKNTHIEKLRTEKRQLQEDLETVWRASAKEQQNLKTSLSPGRLKKSQSYSHSKQ